MGLAGLVLVAFFQRASEPASFREGLALVEAGRLAEAERAFLEALVELPSHAPTSVALARLYSRAGRYSDAERALEEGLTHHPGGIALWNELGSLLLETNRPGDAEPAFRRALEIQPRNLRALVGLAQSLADGGNPGEGIAVIESALADRPDAGELHFYLGALQVRRGEHARALDALSRARELGVDPTGVEVFRGMALAGLGRIDEAESLFRGALVRDPEAPEAHRQLAILYAERSPRESLSHARKALQSLPHDPVALSTAGRAAYALNRDADALDFLSRALAIDASAAPSWITLGRIHFRRGDSEKAREAFESALEASPDVREAHFYLGELDLAALQFESAIHHYREVGSADSERRIAEALSKLGRYDEAMEPLERALALARDPGSQARARYVEATVHLEKADDAAAVAALLESRNLDPHHLETRYLLGTTLARLGRREEAREELEAFRNFKAFEEEKEKLEHEILERPDDADSYVPLIELYLASGRKDEARVFLEKALLLSPGNPRLLELEPRAR